MDAVVWLPSLTHSAVSSTKDDQSVAVWSHKATFNALGYVQAAKQDKKFTTCPGNFSFAVISDCNRHVFVYRQPPEGVMGNSATQHVHTISSGAGILGLRASSDGFVFVLCENELLVLSVK